MSNAGFEGEDRPVGSTPRAQLRRVRPDMFDGIYDGLLRRLDPEQPVERFRRIFEYPWRAHEDYVGLALYDGSEPVGFMGLIFGEMTIEGRLERLCNVTSFIAKETHRAEAALLPLQLRSLRDYTITNLSCNEAAYRVFTRVGFEVLDDRRMILRPTVAAFTARPRAPLGLAHTPEEIRAHVTPDHRKVLEHHRPYAEHLLIRSAGVYCYVVLTIGRRRGLRTARIRFVSDPHLFGETWATIFRALWTRYRAVQAECDSRLLGGVTVRGGRAHPIPLPRLFRSSRLRPEQVPNLYSELVLLNLP